MYYVKVTEGDNIVASTLSDILSEAVSFGNRVSYKGNTVTVYEAVQSLCELELTHKVLSWTDDGALDV
jgi:diphthamide biosynthesis methyltransferase|tara:strand:- start:1403 stop:1606 length:204 start_codon:yes stop_codon:yes gene_type:complete